MSDPCAVWFEEWLRDLLSRTHGGITRRGRRAVGTMCGIEMYVKVIDPHVDDNQGTIPRSSTFLSEHGINCLIRSVHLVSCSFGRSPLLKNSVTQLGDRPCAMTVFPRRNINEWLRLCWK
ncbi:hypothetical protein P692DRAFT_20129651 [Suillus brevipes Sb2]|nr:hypothetical protein P692DRAFT_20129651 [Suillus brevipes Sb2]